MRKVIILVFISLVVFCAYSRAAVEKAPETVKCNDLLREWVDPNGEIDFATIQRYIDTHDLTKADVEKLQHLVNTIEDCYKDRKTKRVWVGYGASK